MDNSIHNKVSLTKLLLKNRIYYYSKTLITNIDLLVLLNKEEITDKDWIEFSSKIRNKTIIELSSKVVLFLERFYNEINKQDNKKSLKPNHNGRLLITFITIAVFPNIVCKNNVKEKDRLIKKSKRLLNLIINLVKNKTVSNTFSVFKITYYFKECVNTFSNWKKYDKEYTIYTMAKEYWLIKLKEMNFETKYLEDKQTFLNIFERERKSIRQEISYIFPKDISFFDNLIKDSYENVEKKLFWINIDYNLFKDDYNKKTIVDLFKETKRLILNLITKNKKLTEEINEMLDIDLIENIITLETEIDFDFYYNKCTYILSILKQLQSPSMDEDLEVFISAFKTKISAKVYLRELTPFFFRYVLDSLERIHKEKNEFLEFINKNKNKNKNNT